MKTKIELTENELKMILHGLSLYSLMNDDPRRHLFNKIDGHITQLTEHPEKDFDNE